MAFVIADRVRETTTTTGTGAVTLAGAYISFQSFSTAIGNGNNTYYTIASASSGEWEVGIGTYTSSTNTLSRDTILASSNSGSAVNFSAGSKDVFVTQPAERSLLVQSAGSGLFAGVAAFTSNGVPYANSTTTLTTGSGLTFDGTTLTASNISSGGSWTFSGGTANGVLYLNGSKVATSGSALTFDGSSLGLNRGSAGQLANFTDGVAQTLRFSTTASAVNIDNPSAGALAFLIASTEQMRLTSTGLGIGTSSPQARLHINSGAGSTQFRMGPNSTSSDRALINYNSTTNRFVIDMSGNDAVIVDGSGNLGLGVTPSAWYTLGGYKVMQIGPGMAFDSGNDFRARITSNGYVNSSGDWKYLNTGYASNYNQSSGQHQWHTAASGTAGNTITFTQAMTLDASGHLSLQNGKLFAWGNLDVAIGGDSSSEYLYFRTNATERARIDSSGNLLVGTTSSTVWNGAAGTKFVVGGSGNTITSLQSSTTTVDQGAIFEGYATGISSNSAALGSIAFLRSNTSTTALSSYTAFYTNNAGTVAERARIDSSGNFNLGTTTMTRNFNIGGSNAAVGMNMNNTGTSGRSYSIFSTNSSASAVGALGFYDDTAGAYRMVIDSSGRLLVGTTTASGTNRLLVDAANSGGDVIRAQNTGGTGSRIASFADGSSTIGSGPNFYMQNVTGPNTWAASMQMGASAEIIFLQYPNSSWSERARIDSSGNWLVGTTSSAANSGTGVKLLPSGYVYVVAPSTTSDTYNYYNSTAGAYRFYVTNAGVINATSTTITAISDQRLKENIRDLDDGLSAIMSLKPRKFDWKAGKGKDIKDDRGWIAQEFEQVFPDMIDTWKDPAPAGEEPYKSVRADLIPVLVKAIQELKTEVDSLKAQLNKGA